jgi:hypothetical protein
MKKCPGCYAIMRESITPTQIPELQHKPIDSTPEVSGARVRYECGQCGHTEESFAKPAPARPRVDDPFLILRTADAYLVLHQKPLDRSLHD